MSQFDAAGVEASSSRAAYDVFEQKEADVLDDNLW